MISFAVFTAPIRLRTGLYVTSPHESSHPEDNWGFVVTYLNSISRSNTTASIKNISTTTAAATTADDSTQRIFAFRAISDEIDDPTTLANTNATPRSRHLHHTVKAHPAKSQVSRTEVEADEDDDEEEGCVSSKRKVARIVDLLLECCVDAGAYDPEEEDDDKPFLTHKTIQRFVLLTLSLRDGHCAISGS